MNITYKKQFFLIFIFLFSIIISNQMVRSFYSKPIDLKLSNHDQNNISHREPFVSFKEQIKSEKVKLNNYKKIYKCEVSGSTDERHRLRWIFTKAFVSLYDYGSNFFDEKNIYQIYKIILGLIIFLGYLSIFNLIKSDDEFLKSIYPPTSIFLIIFLLVSNSHLSELRFSILEFLFVSLGFYFILKKKFYLFLILSIISTLNRESGFLLPILYLIFYPREIKKVILIYIISAICFSVVNFDTLKCLLKDGFLINHNLFYETKSSLSYYTLFKIFFKDYLLYFIFFIIFWKKKFFQKKLILIFVLYTAIFVLATPFHHSVIRLLYVPILMLYITPIYLKNNEDIFN